MCRGYLLSLLFEAGFQLLIAIACLPTLALVGDRFLDRLEYWQASAPSDMSSTSELPELRRAWRNNR